MSIKQLQWMVSASLLAALTAAGAYIYIPIGPVPIVLQNLFVLLAGLLLGSRWGLLSMVIYLLVGAIGIPVFAGGQGGMVHFLGPTGGYLVGFAVCAWLTGMISERTGGRIAGDVLAVVVGSLALYCCGVPWLKLMTGMTWLKSLLVGMVPFLPGDAAKACAAVILVRTLRPVLSHQLESIAP